jgi:FkbM family methyltransferase
LGQLRDTWKHWYRRTAISIAPYAYWYSRFALRGYEEPELYLLPQLCAPGSTVVDVGGNFGMYTYWMSRLAAHCVVFEPIPALAEALRRGFGHRIELHNVALSNETGSATLIIPRISPGLSTIEPRNRLDEYALDGAKRIRVPKQRLDDFGLTNVSFVKVDVEGHEEAVLKGASELLANAQPSLLLELEERHNPGCITRVSELLSGYGLKGALIDQGKIVSLDDFDAVENQRTTPQGEYVRSFIFARPARLERLTMGI